MKTCQEQRRSTVKKEGKEKNETHENKRTRKLRVNKKRLGKRKEDYAQIGVKRKEGKE